MLWLFAASASAAGRYYDIAYPPSDQAGEPQVGVIYTFWIPDGATKLQGSTRPRASAAAGS